METAVGSFVDILSNTQPIKFQLCHKLTSSQPTTQQTTQRHLQRDVMTGTNVIYLFLIIVTKCSFEQVQGMCADSRGSCTKDRMGLTHSSSDAVIMLIRI